MKFAEFHAGQVIELGPYSVDAAEIVDFAEAWDPQWFHTDTVSATAGPFQGLIASGWHSCCIAMRLVAEQVLAGSESYASPGLKYLKWLHPVRPNDVLSLRLTVIEARRSRRRPQLGVLDWRWQLRNQHQVEVLDLEVTSMFKLTPEQ